MNLQDEKRIGELERQVATVTKENNELIKENKSLEDEIDDLESKIGTLEDEAENDERLRTALEMFADYHNWNGFTWSPYQKHITDAPDFIASQALGE